MTTIKVQFHWATYRPDARQYKQQSIEVNPFLPEGSQPLVEIELPVNLLANAEDYLKAGIEGNKSPTPILSIAAVKYLVDEWEKVFSDVSLDDFKSKVEDDWEVIKDTTDAQNFPQQEVWEEDDPSVTDYEKANPNVEHDNWDEVVSPETEAEPWDEKQEDWGSEPNFDN
jgi:hypothetical protein